MPKSSPIPEIHFSEIQAPKLGVEVLTLESLFKRGVDRILSSPHRVHFYHIILFTHGTGDHSIDFTNYAYDDATLLLVSTGQVHQYQVNQAAKGFVIVFTSEFMYENATELNLLHSLHIFEHALSAPRIQLSAEQRQMLHGLAWIIQHEYRKPTDELSAEILRHLLRLMLLQIGRIQQVSAISRRVAPHYQDFVAFRKLVERDMAKSRGVQYYAKQLAASPKKLNELTRQVLNKTAKEFIEEQVILESQRLLAQGNMPIKEIAYRLGFNDPTNLVKFFKKHTRVSPVAFRTRFHPAN
ncbi:MAG: AraC family transcriptional regulator [Chloroflexi bacterium]|nr:AraC family transcriptional regulator [Chloroflexota bacterium]